MPWKLSEPVGCADAAHALMRGMLRGPQERMVCLVLNAQHRAIGRPILVAQGTATSVETHPRDIFREAIRRNGVAVIVGHNHPSGDPEPSLDDRMLTRRLKIAGDLLGIPVCDHIITAGARYVSLAERGLL